jgi:hypothetical protein
VLGILVIPTILVVCKKLPAQLLLFSFFFSFLDLDGLYTDVAIGCHPVLVELRLIA